MNDTIIVTGGLGFIGTNLVKYLIDNTSSNIVIIDNMTYASNDHWQKMNNNRISVFRCDIANITTFDLMFTALKPKYIMHLAAESHVDNSISDPGIFAKTNLIGTFNLLDGARKYFESLCEEEKKEFRFLHVSTDEVYGDIIDGCSSFTEESPIKPSSPYSATKAGSDLLVNAWHRTYGLPTIITHCSNNYGEYQHHEKLIPHVVECALMGKDIPVYGTGLNERDWIYVMDHCDGLYHAMVDGRPGETYNIGANNVVKNIDLVTLICEILDKHKQLRSNYTYKNQISYVSDRKGHDVRYAIDTRKINTELKWNASSDFVNKLTQTVLWFANRGDKNNDID